ncbi:MAG: hypothetical protein EZS26_003018 [Candidatus Ordinivivax streblomastigis]|uniref:Uncharacterized protein n=1 Tax=Candidatus Ordinivivax streblomastigis TaxID=2540710 RepID=A0A5M8NVE0_9BACT|nr:MAG: hypothetical protein EZS26_003018 [Candidatus Ordinivivax streblomastigis]
MKHFKTNVQKLFQTGLLLKEYFSYLMRLIKLDEAKESDSSCSLNKYMPYVVRVPRCGTLYDTRHTNNKGCPLFGQPPVIYNLFTFQFLVNLISAT